MAMSSSGGDDEIVSGINVTPLVDVCLVLVIIFMVTAPILSDPVFKVTLAKAHTREGEEKDKITVTLGKDGRMAIEFKEFKEMDAFENELKYKLAESESKLVILRADAEASHGKLTDIMAMAKKAGALSMTIATDQKK